MSPSLSEIGLFAGVGVVIGSGLTYLALKLRQIQTLDSLRTEIRNDEERRWKEVVDRLSEHIASWEAKSGDLLARERALGEELTRIAGLDSATARELVLSQTKAEMETEMASLRSEWESASASEIERLAAQKFLTVLERTAASHLVEATTVVVPIPNEDMKGRLIGREGRNIRSFEHTTGVDLVIDDTPQAVMISSFDPVRREVARLTLMNLMLDGRIHPVRIEELHEKATAEIAKNADAAGREAADAAGVTGLPISVMTALGNLRFRTSIGQNVLTHSVETAKIASMLAAEMKVDAKVATQAALLHDIGKALGDEWEGPHAVAGAAYLRQHGIDEGVCHAVSAHHHDVEPDTLEAWLVIVADIASAARPGARRESLESFIHRVEDLESLAKAHPGVAQAYAVQAGRELRVVVYPDQMDETQTRALALQLKKEIEAKAPGAGKIKVTVIRESRFSETTT